jgi:broad specificity phosphatase PhoE
MPASPEPQQNNLTSPKRRLIFVRHSLPSFQSGVHASLWELSDEGLRRASLLPQHLIPFAPSRIISSQETKAQQTAQVIAAALHLHLQVGSGLQEHERPQAAGDTSQEQFETLVAAFFTHPGQLVFGSETADHTFARFSNSIDQLIGAYPQETLVIVSHGTVISLYISRKCNLDGFELWKKLGLPFIIVLSLPNLHLQHITETIQ